MRPNWPKQVRDLFRPKPLQANTALANAAFGQLGLNKADQFTSQTCSGETCCVVVVSDAIDDRV